MPKAKAKEIIWEGDIYIDRAADFRNDLLKAFDKYEEIRLSLEKVTDFDVAGIQLIFASAASARLVYSARPPVIASSMAFIFA